MKIAHVTTIDGSLHSLLLNQLDSIQQAGYQVVGISSPGPYVPGIEAAGIRHIPLLMTRKISPLTDLISRLGQVRIIEQRGKLRFIQKVESMSIIEGSEK